MALRPWQVNQQLAAPAVAYVEFSGGGNMLDGDTLSIGGRTYEFDTAVAPGAIVGNVRVDISGGATLAQSITALVAAVNGDASRTVDALDIGGDVVAFVHRTPGTAGNIAIAETVDVGNQMVVSGANFTGGQAEGRLSLQACRYTITAADVTTLLRTLGTTEIVIAGFPSTTAPRLFALAADTSAAGGAWIDLTDGILTFRQVNTNFWVLCYAEPAAGALLAATNVLDFLVGVPGV